MHGKVQNKGILEITQVFMRLRILSVFTVVVHCKNRRCLSVSLKIAEHLCFSQSIVPQSTVIFRGCPSARPAPF